MQSAPPAPKTHTQILRDLGRPERREAQATLSEVFAETVIDAAPVGFVLARLGPLGKPILWIQDRLSRRETGRPYLAGLPEGTEILHLEIHQADVRIAHSTLQRNDHGTSVGTRNNRGANVGATIFVRGESKDTRMIAIGARAPKLAQRADAELRAAGI